MTDEHSGPEGLAPSLPSPSSRWAPTMGAKEWGHLETTPDHRPGTVLRVAQVLPKKSTHSESCQLVHNYFRRERQGGEGYPEALN